MGIPRACFRVLFSRATVPEMTINEGPNHDQYKGCNNRPSEITLSQSRIGGCHLIIYQSGLFEHRGQNTQSDITNGEQCKCKNDCRPESFYRHRLLQTGQQVKGSRKESGNHTSLNIGEAPYIRQVKGDHYEDRIVCEPF